MIDDNIAHQNDSSSLGSLMGLEYTGFKGEAAIDKLIELKQGHIKEAFYNPEIGGIDLFWGDDKSGLNHIIKRRKAEGVNPRLFLKDLVSVIEEGTVFKNFNYQNRINISYKGKVAIITFELRGSEVTALLTAFNAKK
jgi:hypothetical protein